MSRPRRSQILGSIFAAGLGLHVLLVVTGPAQAQVGTAIAEIVRITGRVEILRKGETQWTLAVVGARLAERDEIRALSGASAELKLPVNDTIFLAENSRFVVTRLQVDPRDQTRNTTILHLVVGRVRAVISQAAITLIRVRQSNFAISTPTAVAAARGTIMVVTTHRATNQIAFLQGHGICIAFAFLTTQVSIPADNYASQTASGPCSAPAFLPAGLRALFNTSNNPDSAGAAELSQPATPADPDLVDGLTSPQPLASGGTFNVPFLTRGFSETSISISPSTPRR